MSDLDPRDELAQLAAGLGAHLEREARTGRGRLPAPAAPPAAPAQLSPGQPSPSPPEAGSPPSAPEARVTARSRPQPAQAAAAPAPPAARPAPKPSEGGPRSPAARAPGCASLAELQAAVAECTSCELCQTRKQTVFADGTGSARVLFVGEAPGADEDAQGVPFVGRAGQLLTDIVTKGMKLGREDVYIANVLKCRPPGNRDPRPGEKDLCTPWLDRQIELVDPRVIIPLGRHASQHVLKVEASMGRMRGRVHVIGGRQVVPTYHPAYLLRSPEMKRECWKDIQLAMKILADQA